MIKMDMVRSWSLGYNTHDNRADFITWEGIPEQFAPLHSLERNYFHRYCTPVGLDRFKNTMDLTGAIPVLRIGDPISSLTNSFFLKYPPYNSKRSAMFQVNSVMGPDSVDPDYVKIPGNITVPKSWPTTSVLDVYVWGTGPLESVPHDFPVTPIKAPDWSLVIPRLPSSESPNEIQDLAPQPCDGPTNACDTNILSSLETVPHPVTRRTQSMSGTSASYLLHGYVSDNKSGVRPDFHTPYIVLDSTHCYNYVTGKVTDMSGQGIPAIPVVVSDLTQQVFTAYEKITDRTASHSGEFTLLIPVEDGDTINLNINPSSALFYNPNFVEPNPARHEFKATCFLPNYKPIVIPAIHLSRQMIRMALNAE